jgi:hypothetical protein
MPRDPRGLSSDERPNASTTNRPSRRATHTVSMTRWLGLNPKASVDPRSIQVRMSVRRVSSWSEPFEPLALTECARVPEGLFQRPRRPHATCVGLYSSSQRRGSRRSASSPWPRSSWAHRRMTRPRRIGQETTDPGHKLTRQPKDALGRRSTRKVRIQAPPRSR